MLPVDKERQVFIKAEDTTDPDYGKVPTERTIPELLTRGVLNIDKPPNPTSHEIVAWVKQILGVNKAGHSGTLERS
jgi:tRNA U55 pseudouridine synthase TruB